MTSPAKLTDTQLAILSDASQREDRCLIAPSTLKGGAAQKVAAKLVTAGLVREIKAKAGMEVWRRDLETGQAYSLKLTDAGLKAIAVDERELAIHAQHRRAPNTNDGASEAKTGRMSRRPRAQRPRQQATAPRRGTKIARVVELLQRDQGAKLDELIAATGWLPHTARAALTGLRHRGYDVRLERGENGRASVYRAARAPRDGLVIAMRSSLKSLVRRPNSCSAAEPRWTDSRRVWWSRQERPRGAAETIPKPGPRLRRRRRTARASCRIVSRSCRPSASEICVWNGGDFFAPTRQG